MNTAMRATPGLVWTTSVGQKRDAPDCKWGCAQLTARASAVALPSVATKESLAVPVEEEEIAEGPSRVTVAPVPIYAAGTDCADAGQPLSLHRREGYERTPWMTLGMSSPKIILSDARAS